MIDSELKIQPESFVPINILVETTDLAYFELKVDYKIMKDDLIIDKRVDTS